MDEQLNKRPAPRLAEPVVIRQPQLDSSVPGSTSFRTVMVRRVDTNPTERDPFRTVAVGLTAVGLALLAAALGGATLANIAAGSPADAITVVSPNPGQPPSVLADSGSGSSDTDLLTNTPDDRSNPSLADFIASAEATRPRANGSVAPTTPVPAETSRPGANGSVAPTTPVPTAPPTTAAPPPTAPPPTAPPPTAPPPTATTTTAPPPTTTPTTIAPTTAVETLPVTTVPATAPEPTELPVPSTSLSSTTTTNRSLDTKPGKGNSEDGPGKGTKPGKDEGP